MVEKIYATLLALILFQVIAAPAVLGHDTTRPSTSLQAAVEGIPNIVEREIQAGRIPGAVVLIGSDGKVVYHRAFGDRALRPRDVPMTEDTIFDLASLTKVTATTTAVMQLVEQGKLRLEDPVIKYWPGFSANGKASITVRELLTHYSGLRPDLTLKTRWSGYRIALKMIAAEKPIFPPGFHLLYSDINFEILGELVQRISGMPLDAYCSERIFRPLGMKDTRFKPSPLQLSRVAPTGSFRASTRLGQVHDPTAYRMGGVAGHAGLFSTAADLSLFAQMLLDSGSANGVRILSPATIAQMTAPQTPHNQLKPRGLGWDLFAPFAPSRDGSASIWAYGHTGFTGTSIWIDPASRTYVIILTNRVYSGAKGDAQPLRKEISTVVETALDSF
jgi:serine-type D-Ala-D-Ala carboxypeptidase